MHSLVYVTDPMCSWCWGFSPVIEHVRQHFWERLPVAIMLGGLRPGNTERFDEARRETILGHWRAVHERTKQPFNFACAFGNAFVYDTEPAARAMIVIRELQRTLEFAYLKAIHEAFYVHNRHVTKEAVLADLACQCGVDEAAFLERFRSADVRARTWEEFDEVRGLGITGFPAVLAYNGAQHVVIASGYQSTDVLIPAIETWLEREVSSLL